MKFVNLTPHEISVQPAEKFGVIRIKPSGAVCRVVMIEEDVDLLSYGKVHFRVQMQRPSSIEGIPLEDRNAGLMYIVSQMCLPFLAHRHDVVAPNTNGSAVVRNENGSIRYVKAFIRPMVEIGDANDTR